MQSILGPFKAARKVGTPLLAIRTPDPAATMDTIQTGYPDNPPPLIQWDVVQGLSALNQTGLAAVATLGPEVAEMTRDPVEALVAASKLPDRTILFLHNAHRYVDQPPVAQAVWNLRDLFKASKRTLVLLGPFMVLPAELMHDVLILDEALPGVSELEQIVRTHYQAAQIAGPLPDLTEDAVRLAVDATIGLAAFPAEQAVSLSISDEGLVLETLWERKRQMIEQTPGLAVWRGGETFSSIGGVANAKTFLARLLCGRQPPRAVVFIDEIEKALAGSQGDSSGVSQSFQGTLLTWMQDHEAQGCIFIGPPGAAKSAVAKAAGNTAGIPTISFDLGGMKTSLVGESEARLRTALNVVQAVSQGQALFIATCNSIGSLSPEIRRRFKEVTMFFDLPDAEERKAIWDIYLLKYGLYEDRKHPVSEHIVEDAGWTGAEIKQCCELAYRLDCSLTDAATYIVPVAISAADQIESLRTQAHGRFVSASYPGRYDKNRTDPVKKARTFAAE